MKSQLPKGFWGEWREVLGILRKIFVSVKFSSHSKFTIYKCMEDMSPCFDMNYLSIWCIRLVQKAFWSEINENEISTHLKQWSPYSTRIQEIRFCFFWTHTLMHSTHMHSSQTPRTPHTHTNTRTTILPNHYTKGVFCPT